MAKKNLVRLAVNAENETVQLGACKDIVDRAEGKPQQNIDHTTNGKDINVNIINYGDNTSNIRAEELPDTDTTS